MEKGRARQERRALLAGPAAGFAALSGDEFSAMLKQACQDGTANLWVPKICATWANAWRSVAGRSAPGRRAVPCPAVG